jgi:hypothetical protein
MATRGRPKGTPKTGGRNQGTPNKRSVELLDGLHIANCIPAVEIAKLLTSTGLAVDQKIAFWEKLLPYLFPQRKAIDPEGYVTVEQMAGLLGGQIQRFRQVLEPHVKDPAVVALILEGLRVNKQSSPLENS